MPRPLSDLVGKSFNRLKVVCYKGFNKHKQHTWFCECLCGRTTVLTTGRITSKNNATKSCGCLHEETLKINQERGRTHGFTSSHKNLYQIYYGMLSRCNNPNHKDWKYYGEKGIKVLGWSSVEDFVSWGISTGYKIGLTVDRVNSSLSYTRENCEWVTRSDNTRRRYKA